ncbi:MAG: hypothetical protein RMJ43_04520 [Chloroherpetonaceae bacterium]|nr:hypothetical protein [Chthonomonadaceae bacterium]MDW8207077.1 hypothetical protein [Chloroherpetonaceae bacterium]
MGKVLRILLVLGIPVIALPVLWGLARFNVIPVRRMAGQNPALRPVLRALALDTPALPAPPGQAPVRPDPLEGERKALQAQREALAEERRQWEAQRQRQLREAAAARAAALRAEPDPKSLSRLAAIYEQMPAAAVTRILSRMRDDYVVALLQRMDEKQVAQVLAAIPPERAVRLTVALSRPPVRTASTDTP